MMRFKLISIANLIMFLLTLLPIQVHAQNDVDLIKNLIRIYYESTVKENLDTFLDTLSLETEGERERIGELTHNAWSVVGTKDLQLGPIEVAVSSDGNTAAASYIASGVLFNKKTGESFKKNMPYTAVLVKNAMPSNGTMLGTRGFFTIPCSYHVLVLRQGGKGWFVVWESAAFIIEKAGLKQFEFKVPVSVNKGDIMGYVFENSVGVPYDLGTGNMMYTSEKLSMGNFILLSKLKAKSDKRAYSLGVLGIFE